MCVFIRLAELRGMLFHVQDHVCCSWYAAILLGGAIAAVFEKTLARIIFRGMFFSGGPGVIVELSMSLLVRHAGPPP